MSQDTVNLIDQAMKAMENGNLDASWHFMRRARAMANTTQTNPEPQCPPCHGDYNQGRTCPARAHA